MKLELAFSLTFQINTNSKLELSTLDLDKYIFVGN